MYFLSPISSLAGNQASGPDHFILHKATQQDVPWNPERVSTVHSVFFPMTLHFNQSQNYNKKLDGKRRCMDVNVTI